MPFHLEILTLPSGESEVSLGVHSAEIGINGIENEISVGLVGDFDSFILSDGIPDWLTVSTADNIITIAVSTNIGGEKRIGAAMNSSDYFGLYDTYHHAPKDSINPFLEVFSWCMLSNRFNRPDISIPAFDELLTRQSVNLD